MNTEHRHFVHLVGGPYDGDTRTYSSRPTRVLEFPYWNGSSFGRVSYRQTGDTTWTHIEPKEETVSEWKPTNNPKDELGTAKAPLHLIPSTSLVAMSMAFLEGREKYGQYNWRVTGVRASVYQAALLRHMMAWFDGEDIDPDSGLPHLWKAIACLAIMIDADSMEMLKDDRPPAAPTAGMMADTKKVGEDIRKRLAGYDPYQYTEKNRHDGPQEDPGPQARAPEGTVEVDGQVTGDRVTEDEKNFLACLEEVFGAETAEGFPDEVPCVYCDRAAGYVDRVPGGAEYRCPEHGVFFRRDS